MTATWTSDPEAGLLPEVVTRVQWWRSVRLRIAAAIALLAALLVGSVGLLLADLALESGKALLRQQALAQVRDGLAVLAFGGAPPPGVLVEQSKIPAPVVDRIVGWGAASTTWDDGRVMWAALPAQPTGIIATTVSNAALQQQATRISVTLYWTLGAAVLLAALIAWVIADRLTVRLRDAAQSVNAVIHGRIPPPTRQHDEVAVMTAALASTAQALTERLRSEQIFTSDVAHDLRTPLTALVSASELLDSTPASDRVRRQVDRMRRLVEDLLELARADHLEPGQLQPVCLAETAKEAIGQCVTAEGCNLKVLRDGMVISEPARLRSALINLVQNACRHGRTPIEVTVDRTEVVVRDHGAGFPEELLQHGPRRFAAIGATGQSGLGLVIVTGHLHNAGGRLHLTNHPDGGAVATMTFAPAPARP